MSKKYIALVRHGDYFQQAQTPSAFQPYALNEEGREQAAECAKLLSQIQAEHLLEVHPEIHCSTLLRAWQTAEILSQQISCNPKIVQSDALCERSVGALANLTTSEIEQIVLQDPRLDRLPSGWKSHSYFRLPFPGAESLMMAGERVQRYILSLLHNVVANAMAIIVGHGAAMRHAACLMGILPFHKIDQLSMYHAQPVVFSWDGLHWQHVAGSWKIRKAKTEYTD